MVSSIEVRDAAILADAAYRIGNQSASQNLVGSNWEWLDPTSIGVDPLFVDEFGFFSALGPLGGLHAIIARNTVTGGYGIAFRGTDFSTASNFLLTLSADILGGGISFLPSYALFKPLLDPFLAYTGTDNVLLAGHSLGGAMVEQFMSLHASEMRFSGITFGSPGIPGGLAESSTYTNLTNFGHTSTQRNGDPVYRATLFERELGTHSRIWLPENGFAYHELTGIPELAARAIITDDIAQHSMDLYLFSATKISNAAQTHAFNIDDFSYVISTSTSNSSDLFGWETATVLIGDSGVDRLSGKSRDDILDGGGSNDTLSGGDGNDLLDGGVGEDTAVFEFAKSFYRPVDASAASTNFRIVSSHYYQDTDQLIDVEWLKFGTAAPIRVTDFLAFSTSPPVQPPAPPPVNPTTPPPPAPTPSTPPAMTVSTVRNVAEGPSGSSFAHFTVSLSHASSTPVSFIFSVTGGVQHGQATANVDFKLEAKTITIPAGTQSWVVPITIYGDQHVEPDETYTVLLSNVTGATFADGGSYVTRQGVIRNDDGAAQPPPPATAHEAPPGPIFLELRESSISQVEGASGVETIFEYTLRRTGDRSVETKASFEVVGFGASPASPNDFVGGALPALNVTFQPGESSKTFQVRVQGDATSEAHEYFKVVATARSPGVIVTDGAAFATILNDDGATLPPPAGNVYVSIRPVDAEKVEGSGSGSELTFELTRSGDLNQQSGVNVSMGLQGRTPQATFTDTLWNTGIFTHVFGIGQSSILITVPVVGDSTNEPNEPIVVQLLPNATYQNVVIVDEFAQGLIINDDGPTPSLITARPIVVRETDGGQTAMLRVELDQTTSATVSMGYQIYVFGSSEYPSTANADFVPISGTLTISPGASFAEIPITILGDDLAERLEVVDVRLSNPVNGYFGRSISAWDTGVIIIDDESNTGMPQSLQALADRAIDLGTISPYDFQTINYQIDDFSPTHIYKVRIDEPMSLEIFGSAPDFIFDSAGQLVVAGVNRFDYIAVNETANTEIGQQASLQPGDYYVVLEQDAFSSGGARTFDLIGAPLESNAPLAWIRLNQAGGSAPGVGFENNGTPFAFSVQLSHALDHDVSFNITVRGVTAQAGSDFVNRTYAVTVSAGNTSSGASFIQVNDDALYEGTETFQIVLAETAGVVLPNRASEYSRTLTLLDNESNPRPQIEVRALAADRAEASGGTSFFEFEVFRPSAFSAQAATVEWTVFGDGVMPAVASDFDGGILPTGTVNFAAGEASQIIRIAVSGDSLPEADEAFSILLQNPSAGFEIGTALATGLIRNDDGIYTAPYLGANDAEAGTSYVMSAEQENFLLLGGTSADIVGNAKNNLISANNAANRIFGLEGADTLFGYDGHDMLDGGTGADEMNGGFGNDTYIVDDANDKAFEAEGAGNDSVESGVDYTLDAGQEIERLMLVGTAISGTGNEFNNEIIGNNEANILSGAGGNDILRGGANDDIYESNGGDTIIELIDSGYDVVVSRVSYTLTSNVEELLLDAGASSVRIDGTGNVLDNVITGSIGDNTLNGLAGNDFVDGGDGNDSLDGGLGADQLFGGVGNDNYITDGFDTLFEALNGGIDSVGSSASFVLGANLENLTLLGALSISGTGNSLANTITGNAAANTLNGATGFDRLFGGGGNDTYITDGGDTIVEAAGAGFDTVRSYVSQALGANLENLVLLGSSIINGTGNALANTLTGNAGNNTLNGGGGIDTMVGGGGNDTYFVDVAGDLVTELIGGGTADRVKASATYVLGVAANVEFLETTNAALTTAINLTGNSIVNTITGNAGANTLNAALGADTMIGLGGNDIYMIDNAADNITEVAGGGTGDRARTNVTFTLATGDNIEFLETTNAALTTVVNLTGNEIRQTIIGNAGSNVISGKLGNDIMTGGAGSDFFVFDTLANTTTNKDTITDFNAAADTIRINDAVFAGLGQTSGTLLAAKFWASSTGLAHDADDRIIYNTSTGVLTFDSNGNVAGGTIVQFALLSPTKPVLTNADFVII